MLTFLSSLGLIQNGDYISFSALAALLAQLSVSQVQLHEMM